MIAVQSIKLATDGIKGNLNFMNVLSTYGGMPSGHAAFVTSLSTMVGYTEGIGSVSFAIAAVFSLLIITDAMYFRRQVDRQGRAIRHLATVLPASEQQLPEFSTSLEHTFPQICVGILIGFTIASILHFLIQ